MVSLYELNLYEGIFKLFTLISFFLALNITVDFFRLGGRAYTKHWVNLSEESGHTITLYDMCVFFGVKCVGLISIVFMNYLMLYIPMLTMK